MSKSDFSIGSAIEGGWQKMKQHFWLFFLILIFVFVLYGLSQYIKDLLYQTNSPFSSLVSVLIWVIATAISMGLVWVAIKAADNLPIKFRDLFDLDLKRFGNYLVTSVVLAILPIILGVIFSFLAVTLILPIVFAGAKLSVATMIIGGVVVVGLAWLVAWYYLTFQFAGYAVVDKGLSFNKALGYSWKITKGNKFRLLGFVILLGLINLLGAICLIIGLFATLPLTMVAKVYIYRSLSGSRSEE